jgi:acetyl-CoA synthetase
MQTSVLPEGGWDDIARDFRWDIPADFTIHHVCNTRWAEADPDRVAIIDAPEGGLRQVWTHGRLKEASDRLASAFEAWGVQKGDRVAVLLPQRAEVMVAHLAALKLGAIVLPLFTLFGEEALAFRLSDSGAKVVVTDDEGVAKLSRLELPALDRIVTVGSAKGAELLAGILATTKPLEKPTGLGPEDPAVLIYTSGTTGSPKGALHAHRFLIGHLPCVELSLGSLPQEGDVGWSPADWAWIGALMDLAMPCLYFGVPLVARRMRKFDAAAAWRLIVEEEVSVAFLPPTALKLMRQVTVPEGHRLRAVNTGGESLAPDLLDWGDRVVGAAFNELYGQTECNLVVCSAAHKGVRRHGAIGRAVPGHRVAVLSPEGFEKAPGEVGEICVKKPDPVMFLGYWNRPDKTAEKFLGDWLRTGDLGRMDSDGYISFVSRDDDVITSAGYRIGPTEIENCLTGDPDVVMAAAVGVPDPERTEVVKAFVVLREGAELDGVEARLIARVRERVSPHVGPRIVEVVDSLPMTATGKIMRRALREDE